MKRVFLTVAMVTLAVGGAAPAGAAPPTPVRIDTVIDFSGFPFVGTFTVTEGANALGCSAGTFTDVPRGAGLGQIEKRFTCASGDGAGDGFVVLFKLDCTWLSAGAFRCKPGPGEIDGQWMVLEGTGAFADLTGRGAMAVWFVDDATAHEQLTGGIVR